MIFPYKIGTVTDLWHRKLTLEAPAHPVINTFWLAPVLFHAGITIGLVAPIILECYTTSQIADIRNVLEGLSALLDNLDGHGEFCDERKTYQ